MIPISNWQQLHWTDNHLIPIMSAHPIWSGQEGRKDTLWTPSIKEFWLTRVQEWGFLCCGSHVWNTLPPEVRQAPSLLAFCSSLKAWLCPLAWGLLSSTQPLGWGEGLVPSTRLLTFNLFYPCFYLFKGILFLYGFYVLNVHCPESLCEMDSI